MSDVDLRNGKFSWQWMETVNTCRERNGWGLTEGLHGADGGIVVRTEGSSWKMAAVPSPWWTSKSNTRTDVSPRCRTARRAATARSLMAVNPLREWAVRTSTSRTK